MLQDAWSSRVLGNAQQLRALLGIRLEFVLTDVQGKCLLYYERIGIAYTSSCSEAYSENGAVTSYCKSLLRQPTYSNAVLRSQYTTIIIIAADVRR